MSGMTVNFTNVYGALLMAEDRPCPVGSGNGAHQPLAVEGRDLIMVWAMTTADDAEAWEVEIYGTSEDQVQSIQGWVMSRLRATFEVMGWTEEGEQIPWPEDIVAIEPVRFGAVMFPVDAVE